MSVEAMAWAFQQEGLPTCPKFVLVALANRANEDGYCWPGLEDLERRTGLTDRAIQKALKLMVERHLLTICPRFHSNGRQTSNLYRLCLPSNPGGRGEPGSTHRGDEVRGMGEPRSDQRRNQVRGMGEPRSGKSSSEQSVEPSTEEESPPAPLIGGSLVVLGVGDDDFRRFWDAYPRKVGNKAAWKAWTKARDRPRVEVLLAAIQSAKQSERWRGGYIPNPSTWLIQGRWADTLEISETKRAPRTLVELIAQTVGGV